MAYVLGFFAADGYITVNRRGGQFWCFDIMDKKLIEQIKVIIESNHKISIRKRKNGKYTNYRLQIGSIEMCDDLRKLGYHEKKTKNLSVPHVPNLYFADFIRGYFDGDGNVWIGCTHKERKVRTFAIQTVFTSCSEKFLREIKKRLETFDITPGVLRRGSENYYRLTYSIRSSLKLHDFMYNGLGASKLFLQRKRDVFARYIKLRL